MHKAPWDPPQRPVLPPRSWQQVTEPDFCDWTNPATWPPTCSLVIPNSCHRPCSPPRARAQPRADPAQQGAALQASSVLLPTGNRCPGLITASAAHLLLCEAPADSPPAQATQEKERKEQIKEWMLFGHLLCARPWLEISGGGFCRHTALSPGREADTPQKIHQSIYTKWE